MFFALTMEVIVRTCVSRGALGNFYSDNIPAVVNMSGYNYQHPLLMTIKRAL